MNDKLLQQILEELQKMNQRIDTLEEGMNSRFDELKDSLSRKHVENIKADELILQSQKETLARLDDIERGMYRLEKIELRQNRTTAKVDELEADVTLLRDKLQN
ncbi:hypothetical protein [Aneurinibacillus sp. UBA3580]|jgi:phage terminase small subunit|uniref:hypothetical protein n=1 Tax=Aneurinibacillus sp. UBA3580 TaxID=1946041 RepID=UPI00257DCF52|nr:hypothetical protein [Aneurinibacillus sp. UBA3580]